MNGSIHVRCALGLLALGVACLSGCHHAGRRPARRASIIDGAETVPVTRAQEADVQIALGRVAEQRGDLDQAMSAYREALTRDKHRADAYQRLAVLNDRRGDFRESAALYRKALAASPGNAEIYCDMGYSLYLQRRWAEAEQNLRQAIVASPGLARAHNNLGMVLAHDRRSEEALAEFRKAGNGEADARGNLALALTLDGRLSEARAQYQLALAADPSATVARSRLKELDSLIARSDPRTDSSAHDLQVMPASGTSALPPRRPDPAPSGDESARMELPELPRP